MAIGKRRGGATGFPVASLFGYYLKLFFRGINFI